MKKNILKFVPVLTLLAFMPFVVFAQSTNGLLDTISKISAIFSAVLPVLVAFGVLYFIWGMVQYFIADSEEAKKNGRDRILYGIIGLAVIVSIWGLVGILNQTFNLGGANGLGAGQTPDLSGLVTPVKTSGCPNLNSGTSKFSDYLDYVTCIIGSSIIPFIFAVAVVMFIWGVVKYFIINADEEKKRAEGKQFMLWGIIALAVMISVWGLVNILGTTFGLGSDTLKFLPQVKP
jgi:hypothetical protein